MHTLPYELLSKIFLLVLPPIDVTVTNFDLIGPIGPLISCLLTLTSVCSFWRALAQSTPLLWTDIHLTLDRIGDRPESGLVIAEDRLRAFLTRSKNASISISMHLIDYDLPKGPRRGLTLWALVIPHMARCRNLTVLARTPRWLALILPLRGPFPRLQKVDLIIPYDDYSFPLPWPDLFDADTSVREIHLEVRDPDLLRFLSPRGTVRDISIGVAPAHAPDFQAIQSIANCPNTEQMSLTLKSDASHEATQLVLPYHPQPLLGLRSLCRVMLEEVIFTRRMGHNNILPSFPSLPLVAMTLDDLATLTVDSLPPLFRSCVMLRKLAINYYKSEWERGTGDVVNVTAGVLTDRALKHPLLPQLRNFTIRAYGPVQHQHRCDAATLANLLDNRPHLSVTCCRAFFRAPVVGSPDDGHHEEEDDASMLESSYRGRFICTPRR